MKKRIFLLSLSVLLLFSVVCGCNKTDDKEVTDGESEYYGAVIAAVSGTDDEIAASEYESEGASVDAYEDVTDVMLALTGSRADYAVLDEFVAQKYTDKGYKVKVKEKCGYKQELCAMFPSDSELRAQFDETAAELIADGTVDKIAEAFLDGKKYSLPSTEGDTVVLGVNAEFEPFAFIKDDGEISGIDIAIASEVCARLGLSPEIRQYSFSDMFDALLSGEADFLMSALNYDEDRAEIVSFSKPYYSIGYVVLERDR